ncbi:bifunctional hydroxymethylpyrimidine kinase/phosphomethylpyrimidine kinase [Arcticibacter tournemirensis]|uniref:hydroxymethylpyrimidine kinase n=1 Tax=Arcticibacter tournemirensis TaxID=699437 RepID=A0A4Q0MCP5_9SPHI|nr:bifunctional hydroxymethylpyrimidine kinase/phosphomethylpyrimidine kinase [Arcticibacter tournemirensis]RXF70679.1 bifunctional hydroxymethylpyrimidine kinase/phosphomethylpyrimidine kinase [Arcticibacter tournemirensis]
MKKYRYISVLTIAGSDSGGGAGIQADLKTFSALGCFGASAITAITVQNTLGVTDIHSIPAAIAAGQIRAVMDDIKPSAIKIGMVHSAELAVTIASVLRDYPHVPVILDPVMVATSGDRLIQSETIEVLKKELFPLATLVTPNLDEAEILSSMKVRSVDEMKLAGAKILDTGCYGVLIKGGHLQGETLFDVYLENNGFEQIIRSELIATGNTHGTGCTLSSAIASFIARGYGLSDAVQKASQYIHKAIAAGRDVKTGEGHGPLNHFFEPLALIKHELD